METEGFINRVGGAGRDSKGSPREIKRQYAFLSHSLRKTKSQSVSPRVQPASGVAQRGRFLLSCLLRPRGLGSPWHPALVAVRWRGASESPKAHAHPHANALG